MDRRSGVLLHISSLPSEYGIGSFGKEAFDFVDYLKGAKQSLWQVLPLNQTGFGNSPYQSCSAHSFNPYFINLEILYQNKLLTLEELNSAKIKSERVPYDFVDRTRNELLRIAFKRFDVKDKNFVAFLKKGEFNDYALFMSLREKFDGKPFVEWPYVYKKRYKRTLKKYLADHGDKLLYWQFIQFEAQRQWMAVKEYANKNGVQIIGDMPLYVAYDSVDVWANPKLFKLDSELKPTKVAGVPPDYFSQKGQLWGNPVYNYDYHKRHNFSWWIWRLNNALNTYDFVRIDHFRGLDRYYEIPADAPDATVGEWVNVPSQSMFARISENVPTDRIIAEDLGIIDDGVRRLLKNVGYPGMAVLSFAFNGDGNNTFLPENIKRNTVCYTGTHDNDTLMGYIRSCSEWDYNNLRNGVLSSLKHLRLTKNLEYEEDIIRAIIKMGFKCRANTFIVPMQDMLCLDTEYRMNTPGTLTDANWSMRLKKRHFTKACQNRLKYLAEKYNRCGN